MRRGTFTQAFLPVAASTASPQRDEIYYFQGAEEFIGALTFDDKEICSLEQAARVARSTSVIAPRRR
jgi:hypothetical protein